MSIQFKKQPLAARTTWMFYVIIAPVIFGQILTSCKNEDWERGFFNLMSPYLTPCYTDFNPILDDSDADFSIASIKPCEIKTSDVLPWMQARYSGMTVDEYTSTTLRLSENHQGKPPGVFRLCFGISKSAHLVILRAYVEGSSEANYYSEKVLPEFLLELEK